MGKARSIACLPVGSYVVNLFDDTRFQVGEVGPDCTVMGILTSTTYGFHLLEQWRWGSSGGSKYAWDYAAEPGTAVHDEITAMLMAAHMGALSASDIYPQLSRPSRLCSSAHDVR